MRSTQAQIQRTLRAATLNGTPVQNITHFPDGRVVLSLEPEKPEEASRGGWD